MSTSTSSLSIPTTLPLATSPSSKDTMVAAELGTILPSMLRRSPPEPSTGVALGAGVMVSVADTGGNDGRIGADAGPSHQARRRAYAAGRRARRAHMRSELRGPGDRT